MLKLKYLVVPVFCVALMTSQVKAGEEKTSRHEFSLGLESSYFVYKEPSLMKEKGFLYGLAGAYTYSKPFLSKKDKVYLTTEVRSLWGKVDYESPISGKMENISDWLVETRILGGYSFGIEIFSIAPYTGLGYRYLKDDSAGKKTDTGAIGYKRTSNYFYIPIGVEFTAPIMPKWKAKANIEYDWFIRGSQVSYLTGLPTGYGTIFVENAKNTQKSGYGIKSGITVSTKAKNFDFYFGPYFNYWNIKKSEKDFIRDNLGDLYLAYEPKNRSTEVGLKLGLKF